MTFDSVLVQYSAMTDGERILTAGALEHPQQLPFATRLMLYAKGYFRATGHRDVPASPVEYYHSKYGDTARFRDVAAFYTSPVTGKPIEVGHESASPGNAYVHILTDEELQYLTRFRPDLSVYGSHSKAAGRDKVRPCVYVRIYGEKGILVEGLM
jgi:hypothetical protein